MSLIDLIVGQKVIVLTFGVALLLIMAALLLALIPRIRRYRTRIAEQRAEQAEQARRVAEMEAEAAEEVEVAPVAQVKSRKKTAKDLQVTTTDVSTSSRPAPTMAAPIVPSPAPKAPMVTVSPEQAQQPSGEPAASSAMQDILSSVFSDEGASERQAALLRGMGDVDIQHLLTLSQQVVAQMHGGKTVTVVGSKELE